MILIAIGKGLSEGTLRNRDPERLSNLPKIASLVSYRGRTLTRVSGLRACAIDYYIQGFLQQVARS